MNLTVATPAVGKKCSGPQYVLNFQKAVALIPESVRSESEAKSAFWKAYRDVSAEYHTGSAGEAKYSAPFLVAISEHFGKKPARVTSAA